MTYFDAIILGVVEGITEFLPISSTGHLILAGELLGLPSTEFLKSFDIAIQLGAILAVVALYWRSLFDIEMIKKLAVAFIPTGIIGFALYYVVKTILLDNLYVVLISLALGGIAPIVGGLLLGLPRKTIVEFSFLLAVPTMAAATGYDLMKNADLLSFENIGVLAVGFVVSFVVALAAIRWLLSYVRTHTFIPFGVYRILAALVFWLVILI